MPRLRRTGDVIATETDKTTVVDEQLVEQPIDETEQTDTDAEDQTAEVEESEPKEDREPITDDELTRERKLTPGHGEVRTLRSELTYDRREMLSEELVDATLALEAERERKRSADAVFNQKIKSLELKCQKIATTLDDGEEEGPVQCQWFIDYAIGRRQLVRTDTGAIIDTKWLSHEERQHALPFDDEADEEGADEDTENESATMYNHLRCNACSWTWQIEPVSELPPGVECPSCQSRAVSLYGDGVIAEQVPHLEQPEESNG